VIAIVRVASYGGSGSPPGLIVSSTPNRLTVCAWFGPWPHSLDSLAYMRPLASWSLTVNSSGVSGLVGVCITNPYRIPCPVCERAWCIWFGPPATYQSLPASTCKGHWILVRSAAALPVVTMRYHVSILSLHRPLTFTNHHLRPDTHTDTHMEHTHIEHSRNTAQSEPSGTLDQSE
jgi:hypothetical protein